MSVLRRDVQYAMVLGLSLVSGSCRNEPFNWCTEEQSEDFTRADGSVTIHYSGDRVSSGTVEIVPFVKVLDSGVLLIQGCGIRDGDLWRWRSGFGPLEPGAAGVPISSAGVRYDGEVRVCEDDDCSHVDEIKTVSDADPERWPALGSVLEYEPAQGAFRASIETTTQRDDEVQIEVDIQWDVSDVVASGE
jgi:hypothetical protein